MQPTKYKLKYGRLKGKKAYLSLLATFPIEFQYDSRRIPLSYAKSDW